MLKPNNKRMWSVIALALVSVLVFAACFGNDGDDDDRGAQGTGAAFAHLDRLAEDFPIAGTNNNTILQGGTLNWGLSTTASIPGLFCPMHSSDAADSNIGAILIYSLISSDDSWIITQDGIVTWDMDLDALTFTMTMRDDLPNIYWHDGVQLTLGDLYFAYHIISHQDYTGIRFGQGNGTAFVVGANEFRAGEADRIEGLVLSPDERQLTIHFTQMPPSMLFAGAILATPAPRHNWEGIAVADMRYHMNARDNLLGFGPFYIENVVPGESVVLRANENYWRGRPNLDRVVYQTIHPDLGAEAMRAGQLDVVAMRLQDWEDINDANNIQFLGRIAASETRTHISVGAMARDPETSDLYIIPRDDNHPITNRDVRRAMVYLWDRETIDYAFNSGLAAPATGILHPFNAREWIDPERVGFALFCIDSANELLDAAGFEWREGEDFRRDLDGNPWYINLAMTPGAASETIFSMHRGNFAAAGIDLRQYGGGFVDHNVIVAHNQVIIEPGDSPNSDMHIFNMGWNLGANPNPTTGWGHNQNFNMSRFTNETIQGIHADIASMEAWDPEFLADAYRRWGDAFDYYVPAILNSWSLTVTMTNNRVANWNLYRGGALNPNGFSWHRVGVTAPAPYVHQ